MSHPYRARPRAASSPTSLPSADARATGAACADTVVIKRLQPPQPGTLKLTRRYGEHLVCVRYRRNHQGTHRYTTVELVVDDAPVDRQRHSAHTIVYVSIAFDDIERRLRAIAHGATWNVQRQLWAMPYATAEKLRLTKRIVHA